MSTSPTESGERRGAREVGGVDPATLSLREATQADAPAVQALVFQVLAEYGLAGDLTGADADLVDIEKHYAEAGGWFGVLVDSTGRVVGSVGLRRIDGETAELRKMYLEAPARGRGLGRALLNRALTEARVRGWRRVTLETASVLREAIALYEAHGFRPRPECPNTCRCDRVMELELERF